jgi:hypothetical protein
MAVTPFVVRRLLAPFDVHAFLDSAGVSRRIVRFARASVVFAQGARANSVFYIQQGRGEAVSLVPQRQRSDRGHARAG